jgi:hypothetical protein
MEDQVLLKRSGILAKKIGKKAGAFFPIDHEK